MVHDRALRRLAAVPGVEEPVPGELSHYAYREHLAGKTINSEAVRCLCGAFFVPTQKDHVQLPPCPQWPGSADDVPVSRMGACFADGGPWMAGP